MTRTNAVVFAVRNSALGERSPAMALVPAKIGANNKISANERAVLIVIPPVDNTQTPHVADGAFPPLPKIFSEKTCNERFAQNRRRDRLLPKMLERHVTILNKLGLHARPAAEFVRAVRTFKSTVSIVKDDECYSGASILDVLSANLDCGSTMLLRIDGPDAETAMARLCFLIEEFRRQEERDGI